MVAPKLLWRSTIPDGSQVRCVLAPTQPTTFVVWDLDGIVQGVREFEEFDEARAWATTTLWAALPIASARRGHSLPPRGIR